MVTGPSEGGMVGSALTSPGLGGAQAARAAAASPAPGPVCSSLLCRLLARRAGGCAARGGGGRPSCARRAGSTPYRADQPALHENRFARTSLGGARSASVQVNVHANRHVSPNLGWMAAIEPHRAISDGRHTEENM